MEFIRFYDSNLPLMQVGFLPFIPKPVTESAIAYAALFNFVKVALRLNQKDLPVFCDEGVFGTVAEIIIQYPDKFLTLFPLLSGFHMAKCLIRCIRKYIKGSGLEDALTETEVFGVKILEQVLNGTHCV